MMMPADVDVREPAFWSLQFARTQESWQGLSMRERDTLLSMEEIDWVLRQRDNQTLLIRKCEAASGAPWFQIRTGIVVTLAQMYYYGCQLGTAFDIYKLYLDLPIFLRANQSAIRKRGVACDTVDTGDLPLAVVQFFRCHVRPRRRPG